MNETVYLFALSLPELLDRIVASQDQERSPELRPPAAEKP